MATITTNYGLKKPDYNDNADIGVINDNMDIIDTKMKEIEDAGGGSSITVDRELSTTSENPVQNKVITENINSLNNNFEDSGWVAIANNVSVRKIGRTVWLHLEPKSFAVATTWTTFVTIPSEYCPSQKGIYGAAWANTDINAMYAVGTTGVVSLQAKTSGTYVIGFDCMYFTD